MLKIKKIIKKRVVLFCVLVKISHHGYSNKWQKIIQFLLNYRRYFLGITFLCVDDRPENDLLKSDESASPLVGFRTLDHKKCSDFVNT